ncbi:hypothetical protein [Flexibacterium corallicola]|uniref:hypothetical protein n=1 Tax=Flexibacterium corallicola TaxID=3037259 RepID=UPI00286FA3C2|nr:hypothetical protein [Pseudovibrio sp. M1P-2-3]
MCRQSGRTTAQLKEVIKIAQHGVAVVYVCLNPNDLRLSFSILTSFGIQERAVLSQSKAIVSGVPIKFISTHTATHMLNGFDGVIICDHAVTDPQITGRGVRRQEWAVFAQATNARYGHILKRQVIAPA